MASNTTTLLTGVAGASMSTWHSYIPGVHLQQYVALWMRAAALC
jgi:hypothetical protein